MQGRTSLSLLERSASLSHASAKLGSVSHCATAGSSKELMNERIGGSHLTDGDAEVSQQGFAKLKWPCNVRRRQRAARVFGKSTATGHGPAVELGLV